MYMIFLRCVWLDAGCGKPADTERGRHYARGGERLPAFLRQNKNCVAIERHKGITVTVGHGGSLSVLFIDVAYLRSLGTCLSTRSAAPEFERIEPA